MGRYCRRRTGLKKQDFQRVFRKNKRYIQGCLVALSTKNQLGKSRLGLAISKKHLARAVDRNRIKRLIRESFINNQDVLAGSDIVIMSRPGLAKQTNRQVFSSLDKIWDKIAVNGK